MYTLSHARQVHTQVYTRVHTQLHMAAAHAGVHTAAHTPITGGAHTCALPSLPHVFTAISQGFWAFSLPAVWSPRGEGGPSARLVSAPPWRVARTGGHCGPEAVRAEGCRRGCRVWMWWARPAQAARVSRVQAGGLWLWGDGGLREASGGACESGRAGGSGAWAALRDTRCPLPAEAPWGRPPGSSPVTGGRCCCRGGSGGAHRARPSSSSRDLPAASRNGRRDQRIRLDGLTRRY